MDDDLESELMDLATNEYAYLPQAAHSRPPPLDGNATVRTAVPTATPVPQPTNSASHRRRRSSQLPASLATSYDSGRTRALHAATIASLPAVSSSSVSLLPVSTNAPLPPSPSLLLATDTEPEPMDSGEQPAGWYDQIEMLLATAETKYFAWVGELEAQGSAIEEAFRVEEAHRVERRRVVVEHLKQTRRAALYAELRAWNDSGTTGTKGAKQHAPSASGHDEGVVDVDEMMDKLARVVDDSARQGTLLRRDGLWTALAENLPHVERDYLAKGADEMFMEKMKYKRDVDETKAIVEQHLKALFQFQPLTRNGQSVGRLMNHSLGQTLREFADIFHCCYGDPLVSAALAARDRCDDAATRILPLVAADVNAFAAILVQVLYYKYADLPRAWATPAVRGCVIDALFEHLQPTLHALYVTAFERENAFLSRLCQQMRSSRLDRFGVASVFRLDGAWAPAGIASGSVLRDANDLHLLSLRQYEPVIHRMNALPSYRSPWVKAALVASICRDMDQQIKGYYAHHATVTDQPSPQPSEMNLNADDLAALLAFLIAASPALGSHLATQLALLGSFMESDVAMGEEGFAVATLWTAMNHLCHLT